MPVIESTEREMGCTATGRVSAVEEYNIMKVRKKIVKVIHNNQSVIGIALDSTSTIIKAIYNCSCEIKIKLEC